MRTIIVVFASCAIMMVMIANLLLKPQATKKFFFLAGGTANFLGFLLYGYGYSMVEESTIMAIIKSLFAVFGMFLGKDAFGDMSKLPFFSLLPVRFFFYMAQILALYVTASAAMTAFGSGLINRVRGILLRSGKLNIFPFITEHTLYLGRELCNRGEKVLFICGKDTTNEVLGKIRDMRAVYTSRESASLATELFLKTIGVGSKIHEKPSGSCFRHGTDTMRK